MTDTDMTVKPMLVTQTNKLTSNQTGATGKKAKYFMALILSGEGADLHLVMSTPCQPSSN